MRRKFTIAAAIGLVAIGTGVGIVLAKDLLHPQFTPEKGTFDSPAGKLGTEPDNPWSVTTVAAAVDGKPNGGKITTLVGEVVDYSCYLQLGKHGGKHRDCGKQARAAGMPSGVLRKDGPHFPHRKEEHAARRDGLTNFRQAAIDNMAYVMQVTGTLTEVDGQRAPFVTGYVTKK